MSCTAIPAITAITAIGVDVAKTSLVFAGPCARSTGSVLNQRAVLRAHLVCEATGGCERLLVATAHALKIPVSVLEPSRVRHFAQSLGRWEKTDPIDAEVLREFGQRMPLKAAEQLENNYQALRDWVQLRDHLVERLKVEQTFLKSLPNAKMQAVIAAGCRHLQRQIEQVEAQTRDVFANAGTRTGRPRASPLPGRRRGHARGDRTTRLHARTGSPGGQCHEQTRRRRPARRRQRDA